jgi:hypothetical protein
MAVDKRPLSARLDAYIANLKSIEIQLTDAASVIEAQGEDASPLREGAKLYGLIAEDLRKVLEGEKLEEFRVEGEI